MKSDWVNLKIFANRMEAEVAKAMLESFSIQTKIVCDDLGGMGPLLGSSVALWVQRWDFAEAQELLEAERPAE